MYKSSQFLLKNKLFILILVFLYFFTRFAGVLTFPLFNDETLYIRWIQEITDGYLMRPLENGRQPFFLWVSFGLNTFISNELFSLRLTSVLSGFLTFVGIGYLSQLLFRNKEASYLSMVIYLFFPFVLIHDSLGVLDSMVTGFAVWSFILSAILVRNVNLKIAVALGTILGLGFITKSNAIFSLVLLPFTIILRPEFLNIQKVRNLKKVRRDLIRWIGYLMVVVILAKFIETLILFHPNYFRVLAANGIFIYSKTEWMSFSLTERINIFSENFHIFGKWIIEYFNTFFILLIISLVTVFKKKTKEKSVLIIYAVFPLILLCAFGKEVRFPRYVLPMVVFLIPLIAYTLARILLSIKARFLKFCLLLIIFIFPLINIVLIYFNYTEAYIPDIEKTQYFKNSKVYDWLKNKLEKEKSSLISKTDTIFLDKEALGFLYLIEYIFYRTNIKIKIIGDNETIDNKKNKYSLLITSKKPEASGLVLKYRYQLTSDENLFIYEISDY